jgi:predicted metal-dependent phosphoesterase TrpH
MKRLRAELHAHCADDPADGLSFSPEMLIDAVAADGVDVLALTCHGRLVHTGRLARYADERGVLLVPGIEQYVEGRHVLILNPCSAHVEARDFEALRAARGRGEAIIAPHPYYPSPTSLGNRLERHIDLFDAIEYCAFYSGFFGFNRRAVRVARRHGLPLVGTLDVHALPYVPTTRTWLTAEPTVGGVVEAVRAGRVHVETEALPLMTFARQAFGVLVDEAGRAAGVLERRPSPSEGGS